MRIDFRDKLGKRKTYLTYGTFKTYSDGVLTISQNGAELYLQCLRKKLDDLEPNKPVFVYILDSSPVPEILSVYSTKISLSEFEQFRNTIQQIRSSDVGL